MLDGKSIGVIGMGKIGGTLASSLVRNGTVSAQNMIGTTAHDATASRAMERYGVEAMTDNVKAIQGREIVILAVKPQTMAQVLAEIRDHLMSSQMVITLAAAIRTSDVEQQLVEGIPVVRAMPNTASLVNQGMTVLCPGREAAAEHVEMARAIFSAVGRVALMDNEDLMDSVTGLSGSGPAYGYLIIEALAEGGVKAGLPRELATTLAAQSMLGAAQMVLQTGEHPAKLKDAVTTPAGTTMDGVLALEEGGVRVSLIKAVHQASIKSKELRVGG